MGRGQDAAKHPVRGRAAPTTKSYLGHDVNNAETLSQKIPLLMSEAEEGPHTLPGVLVTVAQVTG